MQEVNSKFIEGVHNMGIHYDYKSTRGDKAMKKEAKRKARIEERRAKRSNNDIKESKEKIFNKLLLSTFILISFSALFFFFISDFLIVFLFSNEFYDSSLPFKILIFSLPLTVLISRMESKFFTENLKH